MYQVRSRGVSKEARVKLTARDLGWADVVFVMEKNHKERILEEFGDEVAGKEIICLFIKDIYEPMQEALVRKLREKLAPHVELPNESKGISES